MSDPHEELRQRLQRESAEADARLRQIVRAELTEERLREDWDRLRGAHRLREAAAPTANRWNAWREMASALWGAHVPQRIGAVAAVAFFFLAGWLVWLPGTGLLRTPAEWPATEARLPGDLSLKLRGMRIQLGSPTLQLAASLASGRRGAKDDTSVFDVHLEGRTAGGEKLVFIGVVVLTNRPGTTSFHRPRDLLGALLDGEITVGNRLTNHISQPFVP